MGVASSSLVNPVRSKALMVRLSPYLVETVCELTRSARDKAHSQVEISGLLYGTSNDSMVTAEALKTFKDSGPRSELARRERMERAFEAALAQAQADPEFASYKMLGWFSLRGSGGLINSDVEFHNRHFKTNDEVALIVWHEGDTQVTTELYARTDVGKFTTEDYRWSSVRLSTELRRVSQPVDLVMRVRTNDDVYVRTYALVDKQERQEEWKKLTSSAKQRVRSLFTGKAKQQEEEPSLPLPPLPKREPSDNSLGRRPFESRTLFTEGVPTVAANPTPRNPAPPIERPAPPPSFEAIRAARQQLVPEISGLPAVIPKIKPQPQGPSWMMTAALVFILFSGVTFAVLALKGVGTGSGKLSQIMRVLFPGTDLELRADGQGDRLLVSWNRKNPVVASAVSGQLTIIDGTKHLETKLDAAQVAEGAVLYKPLTGDVTFKLQVFGTDQSIALASLRVLDATAPSTPQPDSSITPSLDINNQAELPKPVPPPPTPEPTAKQTATPPLVASSKVNVKQPAVTPTPKPVVPATPTPKQSQPPAQSKVASPTNPPQQSVPTQPMPNLTAHSGTFSSQPSNTSINGWDSNTPENKPAQAAPQPTPAQQSAPPDGKTVAFIGPKVLLQVLPNTRGITPGLITEVTKVGVEVTIDVTGKVIGAHLVNPNVKSQLGTAALAAAKQWTFQPAVMMGQKVTSTHTVVFEFKPEGQ
jgi:TonB family protein